MSPSIITLAGYFLLIAPATLAQRPLPPEPIEIRDPVTERYPEASRSVRDGGQNELIRPFVLDWYARILVDSGSRETEGGLPFSEPPVYLSRGRSHGTRHLVFQPEAIAIVPNPNDQAFRNVFDWEPSATETAECLRIANLFKSTGAKVVMSESEGRQAMDGLFRNASEGGRSCVVVVGHSRGHGESLHLILPTGEQMSMLELDEMAGRYDMDCILLSCASPDVGGRGDLDIRDAFEVWKAHVDAKESYKTSDAAANWLGGLAKKRSETSARPVIVVMNVSGDVYVSRPRRPALGVWAKILYWVGLGLPLAAFYAVRMVDRRSRARSRDEFLKRARERLREVRWARYVCWVSGGVISVVVFVLGRDILMQVMSGVGVEWRESHTRLLAGLILSNAACLAVMYHPSTSVMARVAHWICGAVTGGVIGAFWWGFVALVAWLALHFITAFTVGLLLWLLSGIDDLSWSMNLWTCVCSIFAAAFTLASVCRSGWNASKSNWEFESIGIPFGTKGLGGALTLLPYWCLSWLDRK